LNCFLVRHGEIESNLRKIYAGWSEEPLTLNGCQQAREAAENLASVNIETIYCSPLKRAVQTAEIIGGILGLGIKPVAEESFKEFRLGPWEGKSEDQISKEFPHEWHVWNTRPAEFVLPGRETLHELLERTLLGMRKIRAENSGRNVLIVSHVAIIRVLLIHSQGMDLNSYRMFHIPNAKIFHLEAF
jgi:broad specificity phosphatase PhoE